MAGWSGWSALDGSLSGGDPVIGNNADGRLELFAEAPGATGPELAHIWQTAPNDGWAAFGSLGAPAAQFLGFPAVARNADGRLEAFVRVGLMSTGALWHIWQTAPNAGWSGWDNLGGGIGPHFLDVGQNADGRLEVVAINTVGQLMHIWQATPGGAWSPWDILGSPAGVSLTLAVVGANTDGRLEAFAFGSDGNLWHIWQTAPNAGWSGFDSLGSPPGVHAGQPRVGRNADGRLEVFAIGSNAVWHIAQTSAGAGWGSWDSLGTPPGAGFLGVADIGQNADGRLEVFVPDFNGDTWHIWQTSPGGSWSAWDSLGGEPASLAVGTNADGRLELFAEARAATGSHALWHRWQTAPNGGWSFVEDWEQLSLAGSAVRLFTPAGGAIFALTQSGLFRSTDDGASWTTVNTPGLSFPPTAALDPSNANVIYVGGSGALFKTTDGGGSWTPVLAMGPNQKVHGLGVSPANPNLVYAVVGPIDAFTVQRSTDGGGSWTILQNVFGGGPCTVSVHILQPHPTNPNRVFGCYGCWAGRNVPSGVDLDQSTNQGANWTLMFHSTPLFPWRLVGGGGASPSRYYVSGYGSFQDGGGKVFRSDDDGASWTGVFSIAHGPAVLGLAYHPDAPDRVYAGLGSGAVQASNDGGASWNQLGSPSLGSVNDLQLNLAGTFLFAATSSGVWRIPR